MQPDVQVEASIVKMAEELKEQGHSKEDIDDKLEELGYSNMQIKEIWRQADALRTTNEEQRNRKLFLALIALALALIVGMAAYVMRWI